MSEYRVSAVLSLCALVGSILLVFVHLYLSSIFLDTFFFCYETTLDVYEGKFALLLDAAKVGMSYMVMVYTLAPKYVANIAFLVIMFVMFAILFYLRAVRRVHLTVAAQYIELGPLLLFPVMTVTEVFNTSIEADWWAVLIACMSQVVLFLILYGLDFFTSKQVTKIFGGFLRKDSVQEFAEYPSFVFGTMVSVLRIISVKRAEPDFFIRFMNMLTDKRKSSQFIEVARFLGLFPSKREMILTTLKGLEPKWIHNKFMVHMLKKILRSLINNTKQKHIEPLIRLQQQHIIHSHLFWKARQEHRKMRAFIESLAVVHYYKETMYEISSTKRRFPFDPAVVKIESDFYLSACGNFNQGLEARKISEALEVSKNAIVDPILHPMSINNPRILMYCDEEERSASMVRKTEGHAPQPQLPMRPVSILMGTPPVKQKQESVASVVSVSRRHIPWYQYGDFLIALVIIFAYFFCVQPCHIKIMTVAMNCTSYTANISNSLVKVTGSLVGSYVLQMRNDSNVNYSSTADCMAALVDMVGPLLTFVQDPSATHYAETVLSGNIQYFRESFQNGSDICTITENVPSGMRKEAEENLALFHSRVTFMHGQMLTIDKELEYKFYIAHFAIASVVIFVLYTFLNLLTIGIQVNSVFKYEERVIDYMSSTERRNLLLQNRVEPAWNLLKHYKTNSQQTASPKVGGRLDISESTDRSRIDEEEDTHELRISDTLNIPMLDDDRGMRHRHWFTIITLVLPLFCFVCMFLVVYQAMIQRTLEIQTTINTLLENYKVLKVSSGLIRSTMDVIDGNNESTSVFPAAYDVISDADPRICDLYCQERNFSIGETVYTVSADNITATLGSDGDLPGDYLTQVALPCIIRLNLDLVQKVFLPDFQTIIATPGSSGYAFFALVVFLALLCIPLTVAHYKSLGKGFNSLFHFPKEYLSSHKVVDIPTKRSTEFPDMVLAVTYVIESDQIYSISDNCKEILGKSAKDLIGAKMSEKLPLDDTGNGEFRRYDFVGQRMNKAKRFRVVHQKFDKLMKTLMVEDSTPTVQDGLTRELKCFMPKYFADLFCDNKIGHGQKIHLRKSLLIQLRLIDTSVPDALRRIDGKVQEYLWIAMVRAEGSTVTLCTIHDCDLEVGFYVVRDLYELLTPRTGQNIPLYSVMLDTIQDVDLGVPSTGEPYLDMRPDMISTCEQQLYFLPQGTVGIASPLVDHFPCIQNIVNHFNDRLFVVPFREFIDCFKVQ